MAKISEWFSSQLSSSAEGFIWSARQVPPERLDRRPPMELGEWTAVRHVFHMLFYEQTVALPGMRQWLGDPLPVIQDEDKAWTGRETIETLLPAFSEVRRLQIALLPQFGEADWNRVCDTNWGPVTLFWVVSKTYQHTAEHISDVLRIALFWDFFVDRK
jgi:hypothetical protein